MLLIEGTANKYRLEFLTGGAPERVGSCLTCKHLPKLEWLASDKNSILVGTFVNYGHKKFQNIGPSDVSS
jgi:hypothetical protein